MTKIPKPTDEYIKSRPAEVRPILQQLLIYFAAFKRHIGLYPTASAIKEFKEELKNYPVTKGTVQLPLTGPLPIRLIAKIVKFRIKETAEK